MRPEAAERPNILFLFPDQWRPGWLGCGDGAPVQTPAIDRLAAGGMRFTRAFCPSPLCAPSRACIASGRDYDHCRVPSNRTDYPLDQPTLYQHLRDRGYRVAGVGKFDLHKATCDWELDGKRLLDEWGFTDGIDSEGKWDAIQSGAAAPAGPYMAMLHRRGLAQDHVADFARRRRREATHPTPLPDDAYSDNWIASNAHAVLDGIPAGTPWFLQVNFTGPHDPWDVTPAMRQEVDGLQFPPAVHNDTFDADTINAIRSNYAAMLLNIDRHIGALLDRVDERGETDRTLVIFASDHGEMLGDHNLWGKGIWHHAAAGVPLIVNGPGVRRGAVYAGAVGLLDLTATILESAAAAALPDSESRSLLPLLRGATSAHTRYATVGLNDWRSVTDGRHILTLHDREPPHLYDLVEDPGETHNLAAEQPAIAAELAAELTARTGWHPGDGPPPAA